MRTLIVLIVLLCPHSAIAQNTTIDSFSKAKKLLLKKIYYDHRKTVYCDAKFSDTKKIYIPVGFKTKKHVKRAARVEWEHIVPAENFGRTFKEWREGSPVCKTKSGKTYKGRRCAEKTNQEYRYMQADLHNLFPAIGAVNAQRSNYNFTMIPDAKSSFGSCEFTVASRKAQPTERSMGVIARTYKYMEWAYPRYSMSSQQKKLMDAWNKMYPVSDWECKREKRIENIQGNINPFVSDFCPAG